jgi:hypothetical protein
MPERYFKLRGITFDRIRANGGVCSNPRSEIKTDLDGVPFKHGIFPGGAKYCSLYQNRANTTLEDWQIFRHWTRAALRQESVQRYLINRWLEKEWLPSYRAVIAAVGTIEEAMINARIRNSSPVTARCALKKLIVQQTESRLNLTLTFLRNVEVIRGVEIGSEQ